jgi:hypothetical protein
MALRSKSEETYDEMVLVALEGGRTEAEAHAVALSAVYGQGRTDGARAAIYGRSERVASRVVMSATRAQAAALGALALCLLACCVGLQWHIGWLSTGGLALAPVAIVGLAVSLWRQQPREPATRAGGL